MKYSLTRKHSQEFELMGVAIAGAVRLFHDSFQITQWNANYTLRDIAHINANKY